MNKYTDELEKARYDAMDSYLVSSSASYRAATSAMASYLASSSAWSRASYRVTELEYQIKLTLNQLGE